MNRITFKQASATDEEEVNDWVLVFDDLARERPRLGSSYQNILPVVEE